VPVASHFFKKLYPLKDLSLNVLSEKSVDLLASINCSPSTYFCECQNKQYLCVGERVVNKNSGVSGRFQATLVLSKFTEDYGLCIASAISKYPNVTKLLRDKINNLFLMINMSHRAYPSKNWYRYIVILDPLNVRRQH
jgi:hypothetical protein